MRKVLILAILPAIFCVCTATAQSNGSPGPATAGAEVIREMNLARQHPERYALQLEELRGHFRGDVLILPGRTMLRTREGAGAVDDAIRFLQRARPLAPLIISPGISLAAAEHVADQAAGAFGHGGSDHSDPGERMNRHGTWSALWGENIAYGKATARDAVVALIIDDGLRSRKHRKNIFNPAFNYAGAALGPHACYGTVCSIDFAGGYVELANTSRSLLAHN
ncbi:MAG TPA: CAP domain-containing protein [Chthoniobacterales bacterium]|nr:CAP domain-containing protein [Chthoniobacterales bacterium]